MPLPTNSHSSAAASLYNGGTALALPLPPKPALSAVYSSSLPCVCTALLPTSTASSRRSSLLASESDSETCVAGPLSLLCACRSFSSHQWIARKCRDCGHDRSVHRMEGEAADEAEKAAEEANYAHVGTTIINSARGQAQEQQLRPLPAIITQFSAVKHTPTGEVANSGEEAAQGASNAAGTSMQTKLTLRQPPSPSATHSPLSLSGLSPRSPPPPPPIGRSPPAPPSRRPPTSPSPRPAGAVSQVRSTPATPLTCAAVPSTPPPTLSNSQLPVTLLQSSRELLALSAVSSVSSSAHNTPLSRPVQLAQATPLPLPAVNSGGGSSSNATSCGPPSPSSAPSAGPSPTVSDYASLHSLYSMQFALRATAESELHQCQTALAQLEAAAGSTESASALHIRSLLSSLAAAQKQIEAAQHKARQDEEQAAELRSQLKQERLTAQQACDALQHANKRLTEQVASLQDELRLASGAALAKPPHMQPVRRPEAEAEHKEVDARRGAREDCAEHFGQMQERESEASQQSRWASPPPAALPSANWCPSPISVQPAPPVPRRPAQPSGSPPPSCYSSPFSSVAASLTSPLQPPPPPPPPPSLPPAPADVAYPPSARAPLSSLRAPLTVESVLHYFHASLRLSDAYLAYLAQFVEEALEQHSSHAAQMAAVADIAAEVEQNAYELLARIGAGGFGEVYEGRRKKDGERVAIKVSQQHKHHSVLLASSPCPSQPLLLVARCTDMLCCVVLRCGCGCCVCQVIDLEMSSEDVATISQEVLSLSSTRMCAQLVSYYGCCVVHTSSLWLVMELVADGSLLHHLQQQGPFSEDLIAIVCKEVLLGLQYMGSEGKIHRDVKSANILVSVQRCRCLLTDFGASRQLSDTLKKCNTLIGSPYWMAPEVLLRDDYDGKADIWSLGITLIELATGRPPHAHIAPMQVMVKIVEWPAPTLASSAPHGREFSASFAAFVGLCLQKDPNQRATVTQLLKHDFIRKARSTSKIRTLFAERFVGGKPK